jgi:6-phosphogluconolactonase (cycloisomerase 2 family)
MNTVASPYRSWRSLRALLWAALALLALALLAGRALAQDDAVPPRPPVHRPGAVYVMSNDAAGNAIQVFDRAASGALTAAGEYPTGGLGSGAGLGSQGAVIHSDDGRYLFAVNAGSDEISSFRVRRGQLRLVATVPSGGDMPISLTFDGRRRLVVLNAGGSGNVAGFIVAPNGGLRPMAGATQPLSNGGVGPTPGPAQVSFTPNGRQLVVTEKATNMILTYAVRKDGIDPPIAHPSAGQTPFGFAFGHRNTLIVSEAFGGAADASALSSYRVGQGVLTTISPSAATHQTAACWVVVTGNGKYTYTTNTGSASVTGYAIDRDGRLTLLDADGRTGETGQTPIDAALSSHSQYLYVLNAGSDTVSAFAVERDGSLTALGEIPVAATSVGIAAR